MKSRTIQTQSRPHFVTTDQITLIASIGLPIIVSFFIPALPKNLRVPAGVAVGTAVVALLAIWIARSFRNEIAKSTTHLAGLLAGYSTDDYSGSLFKGALRNVSLRVSTVHRVLETIVGAVPPDERKSVLYAAGYAVGLSWGRDFKAETRRTGMDEHSLEAQLQLWSDYDASAGMGRFEFMLSSHGYGEVILRNGFLSQEEGSCPLDHFFSGYLAGTLQELLGTSVRVDLEELILERHDEASFRVEPTPSGHQTEQREVGA